MFTQQHYKVLARILHQSFKNDQENWHLIYDQVYTPLVREFEKDNEQFDATKFSWAVATGEGLNKL